MTSCTPSDPPEAADPGPQPGVEELLSGSFVPGPDEERTKREHALAGELARTLDELDGVERARVHLSLADRSLLSRDREAQSSAAVLIRPRPGAKAPPEDRVRALVAAAVRGLTPEQVEVFVSAPAAAAPETVRIGPLEVAAGSAATARIVIGGLLLVCILLAGGLIYAGLRLRRLKTQ